MVLILRRTAAVLYVSLAMDVWYGTSSSVAAASRKRSWSYAQVIEPRVASQGNRVR